MHPACPLCGRDKYMRKPKQLYGHDVCKKCVNAFANRRQIAWIIDMVLVRVGVFASTFALGLAIGSWLMSTQGDVSDAAIEMLGVVDLAFVFVGMLLIMIKDGFGGRSPGKMLLGVRVVEEQTGQPIGFMTSLKRNWLTVVPFMVLVMGMQLLKGKRAGDGLAKTRVVWDRHATSPVFAVGGMPVLQTIELTEVLPDEPRVPSSNPYESPRY